MRLPKLVRSSAAVAVACASFLVVGAGPAVAIPVGPAPVPAPLAAPGSALGSDIGGFTAGDDAWLASEGIDAVGTATAADGVVSAGAAATAPSPVGVALGGVALGYFIGSHATFAWNWYFGSAHAPDSDGATTGDLSWHSACCASPFVMGFGGIMGLGAVNVLSHPPDGTPSVGGDKNEVQVQVNFDTGAHNANLNTVFIFLSFVCQDSTGGTGAEYDIANYTAAFEHPYQGNITMGCATSAFAPTQIHVWNVLSSGLPDRLGGVMAYNQIGSPSQLVGPLRHVHATGNCQATDGSVTQVSQDSVDYHEGDTTKPPIPAIQCLGSDRLVAFTAVEASAGLADVPLFSWTATDAYKNLLTTYPTCANDVCQLKLSKLDLGTGTFLSCFTNEGLCSRWFTDPDKTANYQCTYGGQVIALSECNSYAPTFDTDVPPAADGSPQKVPYSPPDTTTDPNPTSGTSPSDGCPPPLNWGLSLVTPWWYYKIGQCVLGWAFVPPAGTLETDFTKVKTAFGNTAVGTLVSGATSLVGPFATLGSAGKGNCDGPPFSIPSIRINNWHPFSACNVVGQWVSNFWLPLSAGLIYFGGFLLCARMVLRTIGMEDMPWDADPGVKPW